MTIDIDATFRGGAIHPDVPLNLPENTPVRVQVAPKSVTSSSASQPGTVRRPAAPRITPEEFRARIEKYAVHVGTLPIDFSREDIYSDHD